MSFLAPGGASPVSLTAPFVALWRALRAMSVRTVGLSAAYLALALTVLATVAAAIDAAGGGFRATFQRFLFPEELQPFAELAVDVVFRSQSRALVSNLTATIGLFVVSLILFFVKERLSQSVETDLTRRHGPPGGPPVVPFPFWREALEEVGLLAIYAALGIFVFALGQSTDPTRRTLAVVASYAVLFWTWAVDFLAPALFRRRIPYRGVFRLIRRRPWMALGFGAVASLPIVGVIALLDALKASATTGMIVNVALQGLAIVVATWTGTALAVFSLKDAEPEVWMRAHRPLTRLTLSLAVVATLIFGAVATTDMARALALKAQILKCSYRLVPGSVDVTLPEVDPLAWATGQPVAVGLAVTLEVTNDTQLPVALEATRVEVADGDQVIATTTIEPFTVPKAATITTPLSLTLALRPAAFLKGASLNPATWSVALWVRLDSGLDFPIPLRVP